MTNARDQYIQLMTSLPKFGREFTAKQTPLSRIKLDQRLAMITEQDQLRLQAIERVFEWDGSTADNQHVKFNQAVKQVLQKECDLQLCEILLYRLNLRTLVAALSARYRNEVPERDWSVSPLTNTIKVNWQAKFFRLEHRFSWLAEANHYIEHHQPLQLELLIFKYLWTFLRNHPERDRYSFVSVVIYVMQWDLVSRWLSYQPQPAEQRFEQLLNDLLPTNYFEEIQPN